MLITLILGVLPGQVISPEVNFTPFEPNWVSLKADTDVSWLLMPLERPQLFFGIMYTLFSLDYIYIFDRSSLKKY